MLTVFSDVSVPQTIGQVIQRGHDAVAALGVFVKKVEEGGGDHVFIHEESLQLGPCVPHPGKIIGIGLNYKQLMERSKASIPEFPLLFNKFSNAVAAPGDTINLPFNSTQVDYEAELVIVMGKRAKRISKEDALDYVFGYCNANDLSARDLQYSTSQWLRGKSCDGFCPLGPYLVTADEVGNPNDLDIRCYVNGVIRQNSNTSDMIRYCDEIVSYVSQHFTLEPGDIILTGTPDGIVLDYPKDEQEWLKDGDEVTVEIDKLGRLLNRMKQE